MRIDPAPLDPIAIYKLLTGMIVPRPIAWVTTRSPAGVVNLAPFSGFTILAHEPAMVGITVARKGTVLKDTARNIHLTGEFVVHIADQHQLEALHESAVEYPEEVSEPALLGIALVASETVAVPRVARAPVAMECRFARSVPFGHGGSELIAGEVTMFHVREGLVHEGKIDAEALDPVCRLGGPKYARLGPVIRMRRIQTGGG